MPDRWIYPDSLAPGVANPKLAFKEFLSLDHVVHSFLTTKETLMRTPARLLVPIMVLCLFPGWSTSAGQSDDAAVIDKFIASQAEKARGSEPDGIRKKQRNVP
jgi:hypothetical protein